MTPRRSPGPLVLVGSLLTFAGLVIGLVFASLVVDDAGEAIAAGTAAASTAALIRLALAVVLALAGFAAAWTGTRLSRRGAARPGRPRR